MKMFNLKSLVGVAALGLALIAGVSSVSAQDWRYEDNDDYGQSNRREERLEREREQMRLERQRMESSNRYRVYQNGGYYNTDSRGADLLRQAVNQGYRQGFAAGRSDRNRRIGGMNWGGSGSYRSGSYGYQNNVDRSQYQYYFRQGFERGYRDGYNSRNQYGSYNNGSMNILGTILGSILNIQRY